VTAVRITEKSSDVQDVDLSRVRPAYA